MRNFIFFLSFLNMLFTSLSSEEVKDPRSHLVIVSIAPYKFFVEAIAGDTAKVGLFVPPETSFHNYEPTPRQVLEASHADIWFTIGESFEARALQAIKSHHPNMRIIDLRQNVDLITVSAEGHQHCCNADGADLHIWLSPKQAKIQSETIAKALIEIYPEHKQEYEERLKKTLEELDKLDIELKQILAPIKIRTIMVSHPAYAYFARDYSLVQLPIEFEGKDPSPKQLGKILEQARQEKIKTIFVQKQHSAKGAYLIANVIGAEVVELNPYSGDYFTTLRTIAQRIASQELPKSDN